MQHECFVDSSSDYIAVTFWIWLVFQMQDLRLWRVNHMCLACSFSHLEPAEQTVRKQTNPLLRPHIFHPDHPWRALGATQLILAAS